MAAISFSVRGHFSYCKVSIFLDQKLQAIAFAGRSSLGLWMPQKRCICSSVAFLACSLIDRQIASYFAFLFCFWVKQGYWLFFFTGWLVSWGLSSTFFQLIDVFVYKTFWEQLWWLDLVSQVDLEFLSLSFVRLKVLNQMRKSLHSPPKLSNTLAI